MPNPFTTPYDLTSGATLKNVNPNSLINIYSGMGTANSTPSMITPQTETLPNGGGTFNPAGGAKITPSPIFTGAKPVQQTAKKNFYKSGGSYYYADTNQKILNLDELKVASRNGVEVSPPASAQSAASSSFYDKYRDPKTGKIMTPEEWGVYLGNKVPKGTGEIPNYAGDAMTNPNQTAAELQTRATNLNNSRNDIATGTTDPYKVGNKSGIAYSPTELAAIEKAYAGVYDPALNDVFARLKTKQEEDAKAAASKASMEERVFATNEAIRQWRATTGTTKEGRGEAKDIFTKDKLQTAARNAGLSLSVIEDMDEDLINFFVSPKKATDFNGEEVEINKAYASWFKAIEDGDVGADEVVDAINETSLLPAVKTYYIDQIPAEPEKKEGWLSNVWGAIWGK